MPNAKCQMPNATDAVGVTSTTACHLPSTDAVSSLISTLSHHVASSTSSTEMHHFAPETAVTSSTLEKILSWASKVPRQPPKVPNKVPQGGSRRSSVK
ncbi:hypothetical protein SODALDRAFT_163113 [Sodiomyces alkalinus F11]|uniref:Uncharacterized protein n=1 Tax=Sodiomyces alkalinus (strain CBS 110278 / VKM F-3762 / F11) TaxID=1314773 RepID=A0A3N2PVF3_SODAK|nr:hypothetical protein SODALDRAFT_163113 [Sodiomyces alkalinus F11]ROT38472.1 hypothetical protein SODALDRAFT_163113 [Sodiomyces alkalinus F11]